MFISLCLRVGATPLLMIFSSFETVCTHVLHRQLTQAALISLYHFLLLPPSRRVAGALCTKTLAGQKSRLMPVLQLQHLYDTIKAGGSHCECLPGDKKWHARTSYCNVSFAPPFASLCCWIEWIIWIGCWLLSSAQLWPSFNLAIKQHNNAALTNIWNRATKFSQP